MNIISKNKKKEKKELFQDIFFSIFIAILFLGMMGFFAVSGYRISKKEKELSARIEVVREELRELEEKNQMLKEGIYQAEDETYWEEKVREQGYKKTGEQQVVVVPPEEDTEEETTQTSKSWWEKIKEIIGF